MLFSVIIATEGGIPIYSKTYGEGFNIDETLILAFFSALKTFAVSFTQSRTNPRDDAELQSIRIGNAFLDFDSAEIDPIGRVDVLLLSEEMDRSSSQAILSEITEKFAIFMDEYCHDNPNAVDNFTCGRPFELSNFDSMLKSIVDRLQSATSVDLGVTWTMPTKILNLVKEMFKIKPLLAETYNNDYHAFFEQVLLEYANSYLEKDIKRLFKSAGNGSE
jgi:hypothetical protein